MCIVLSKSGAVAYAHLRLRAQKGTNEQETRPAAVAIATVILARYFIFFKRRFWWYCWDGDLGIIAYQNTSNLIVIRYLLGPIHIVMERCFRITCHHPQLWIFFSCIQVFSCSYNSCEVSTHAWMHQIFQENLW